MAKQVVLDLPLDELFPDPSQPRKTLLDEELQRLAASIAARGILHPLRVRWEDQRGCYFLITGECRWRAARIAGLKTAPCLPVEGELSETDNLADQIIENSVRNALRPLELARSLAKLKSLKGATSRQLSAEFGLSEPAICRAEALLTLPDDVQAMVDDRRIAESVAYELSRLPDAQAMRDMAHLVVAGRLNRDQVVEAVRGRVGKRNVKPKASRVACKLDGGISFTLSAGQPLTWDDFNAAMDRVRKEAKKLYEGGKAVTDLSRSLRAS